MTTNENIVNIVSQLLTDGDYSQKQLSIGIKVSESAVSKILKGEQAVSIEQLVKISKFFDVRIEYLLGLSPDKDEVTHKTRILTELFDPITTTREFVATNEGIIDPADLKFAKEENYTILTGSNRLFSLIDQVADLNSRKKQGVLKDKEFKLQTAMAWQEFCSNVSDTTEEKRFLISPEQLANEKEIAKYLQKLLDLLSKEEV